MPWACTTPIFAKCQVTEAKLGPSCPQRPVIAIVAGGLHLVAYVCFIEAVNGNFIPHSNLTLIVLFFYVLVYISHKKRDHPILESFHKIETFPSKNISLQTCIVGEAQEQT